jgi:hypothetical protein
MLERFDIYNSFGVGILLLYGHKGLNFKKKKTKEAPLKL